jgi:hypothetical protein
VLTFLQTEVPLDRIKLNVTGPKTLREGSRPTLRFKVLEATTERPVCGARVEVLFLDRGSDGKSLFTAETDRCGETRAELELPESPGAAVAIVCRAEAGGKVAEVKRPVRKHRAPVAAEKARAR